MKVMALACLSSSCLGPGCDAFLPIYKAASLQPQPPISRKVWGLIAAASKNGSSSSQSQLVDTTEPVFDNGQKTPVVSNLQAYGLPEEDWNTATLSFVVVGASGALLPFPLGHLIFKSQMQ